MVDKWYLICNPIARGGQMKKRWPELQRILQEESINYDWIFTRHNNHAIEITRKAIKKGYRRFAVVGGDGTINEVVNGIFMQHQVDTDEILFALIPLGTANDWSRTHRLPKDLRAAVRLLKTGTIRTQDIGLADFESRGIHKARYFNNVAGLAYDAFVVKYLEDHVTKKLNKILYILYVFRCLFKFSPPSARVEFDHKFVDTPVYTVNVGLCKYNGGGLRLVPQADPDDGQFALTIARNLSKWKVILNTYRFYTGTIGELKEVITTHAKDIQVLQSGDQKVMLELDGEFMGYAPVSFRILPHALRYIGIND